MTAHQAIYLIAGEASGDFIGASLMASLRAQFGEQVPLTGIGGERMQSAGLQSLFPMQELSLMGFAEVVPHIFHLKKRIRETVDDIIAKAPAIVITIDSPGFNNRVVDLLRQRMEKPPVCIHLVAPTVWAYKPQRAEAMAKRYDHLLVILPCEPPYFTVHGLKTDFIGHPVAWDWKVKGDGEAFRKRHAIAPETILVGMMPGSRINEIRRHLPVFEAVAGKLKEQFPTVEVVMPLRPAVREQICSYPCTWPVRVYCVEGDEEKKDAFAACQVALAKSGTVALETALAGIATVTAYRANAISAWIVKRMIRVPYVNLVNILLKREVIHEFLQERCTAHHIAPAVIELLAQEESRKAQLTDFQSVGAMLGAEDVHSPSDKAAAIIAGYYPR